MALTYAQQTQLADDVDWQKRVQAAAIDVALTTIRALPENAPNETPLKNLAVGLALTPERYTPAIARLVAASSAAATMGSPPSATGTDAQIRTQVNAALPALLRR